jgi:hypothetical protein
VSTRDIRTSHTHVTCDVCGRTLLRGEHAETYLAGGARRSVCELCTSRALHEGWVREGSAAPLAQRQTTTERRSLLGRLRTRREPAETAPPVAAEPDGRAAPPPGPREPRHVHAVPTSAEQRVVAAIEAFNTSEYPRTVAGVARSLGAPGVSVRPSEARLSIVNAVVSWELCWYRYEIDLSEERPSVRVSGQGYELDELPPEDLEINAAVDERGAIALS